MWREFREFAMRGSVVDLAIGFVIGAAFGKIVTSFVNDILMPPLGLLLGHVDFSSLFINPSGTSYAAVAEAKTAGAPTIDYGIFINSVIDFLIVAFAVFLVMREMNRFLRKPARPPATTTKDCPYCASAISLRATRCPNCTSQLADAGRTVPAE